MSRDGAIAIFDSGIGGLTVLRAVHQQFPSERLIYLGDTARVPYGTKSGPTVTGYAMQAAEFLLSQGIKLLIAACNTASAVALRQLQDMLPVPVLGVIEPGAARAVDVTHNGRIGVIATEGTVQSGAYPEALRRLDSSLEVHSVACPLFVPLVEAGWSEHKVARMIAGEYLAELSAAGIDTLVLGCTHYPLLQKILQEELGDAVQLVDSAAATADAVAALSGLPLRPTGSSQPPVYFVTDLPDRFCRIGSRFFGEPLTGVRQVDLEAELRSSGGGGV